MSISMFRGKSARDIQFRCQSALPHDSRYSFVLIINVPFLFLQRLSSLLLWDDLKSGVDALLHTILALIALASARTLWNDSIVARICSHALDTSHPFSSTK